MQTPPPEKTSGETSTISNTVKVTFPEGFTVSDIALRLEEYGVCPASEFMSEANKTEYAEDFGFEIRNPDERAFLLEGYLFPDTYEFYRNEPPSSVIKRFLRNTRSKITDDIISKADELGYTVDEILILASIIQEEASYGPEAKKVSSVLHNRLNNPSFPKLQCDACSFYLKNSVKPYVAADDYERYLQLYSTYNCEGLPAGPITNSGIDIVYAALYPEETDYYFFISNESQSYIYSSTWEEHSSNCVEVGIY